MDKFVTRKRNIGTAGEIDDSSSQAKVNRPASTSVVHSAVLPIVDQSLNVTSDIGLLQHAGDAVMQSVPESAADHSSQVRSDLFQVIYLNALAIP